MVLKGLLEDGQLILQDGRKIVSPRHFGADGCVTDENTILMHPDFRLFVLVGFDVNGCQMNWLINVYNCLCRPIDRVILFWETIFSEKQVIVFQFMSLITLPLTPSWSCCETTRTKEM